MRKRTVFVVALIMLIVLVGCGKTEDLTGKWVCTEGETSTTLELFSDGTGTLIQEDQTYSISWIAENGRLKISASLGFLGEYAEAADYKLKKDTLTFIYDDDSVEHYKKE